MYISQLIPLQQHIHCIRILQQHFFVNTLFISVTAYIRTSSSPTASLSSKIPIISAHALTPVEGKNDQSLKCMC